MSEARAKPVPVADELSAPFWAAARAGKLMVQRCDACGYYNHPPRAACDACLSRELQFAEVSGRGKIYSFAIMHQKDVAGFEDDAPFINLIVELEEQPVLLMAASLPIGGGERVRIGAPVTAYFEERGAGVVVPQFRIVD